MKNSDLTLNLIDTPEDNEVVINVSGNFHKILSVKISGNKTILNVEGSIDCIDSDKWEFYQKQHPRSSLINAVEQHE